MDALRGTLDLVRPQTERAFPGLLGAHFEKLCRDLAGAAPPGVALAYARHAPACAPWIGAEPSMALANAARAVAQYAGGHAGALLAESAPTAARVLRDADAFALWLRSIALVAQSSAASAVAVLGRTEALLSELGAAGLERWVREGLRATETDPERRAAFFTLHGAAARHSLARAESEIGFAELGRQLGLFATALWGVEPLLQAAPPDKDGRPRRTSFAGTVLRLPPAFRGIAEGEAVRVYRAAVAHVMAHLRYGGPRFLLGGLKPLQVALVSLIEDARVEQLAMRDLPGLRRLWQPYHAAGALGAVSAPSLMARLARALIDRDYADDNAWLAKGRRMFHEAAEAWHDPAISRRIGDLLGNDLGQMRVQFNPRTYAVEPLYRDDNLGLWDFGDGGSADADEDALPQPARLETESSGTPPRETDTRAEAGTARAVAVDAEIGIPLARYPEWDHLISAERRDWTTVVEYAPPVGDAGAIAAMLLRRRPLLERITALIRTARISRPVRLRRQTEGEQIDVEAALAAAIDRRVGLSPDPRVYARFERRARDLSALLLLDSSQSTNDLVPTAGRRVLEMEVEAAALFAEALQRVGDSFAVRAFCSNRRADVRYYRIKDFASSYATQAQRRLAGLTGQFSTRMGAALRHAGAELGACATYRRLLLIITDGEPSDVDVVDRRYLVEDARRAVQTLAHDGIDVFCIGLDGGGESYLHRIFGARNVLHVDRLEGLPERLATLYVRLTA